MTDNSSSKPGRPAVDAASAPEQTDGEPAKPKGGLGVLVLLLVVAIPAVIVGQLLHVGSATIIVAFVALTSLMASIGGPLRSDLRILIVVGPVIAVAASAPRLLAEISRWAAIPLIVILIFVAALLPIRGPRLTTVGTGLGMATLLAYGIPLTGPTHAGQLIAAAALGVVVAAGLRILMGVGDPTKVTREAIADVLSTERPDLGAAVGNWLGDRPVQWLGQALAAAARYRTGFHTVETMAAPLSASERAPVNDALSRAQARAAVIADQIRAKHPPELDEDEPRADSPQADSLDPGAEPDPRPVPAELATLLTGLDQELDRARDAAQTRDSSTVAMPDRFRRRVGSAAVEAVLHARAAGLRHALRTALGVSLALLLSLRLPTGDPLLPTLLITVFTVLQTTWTASLVKARQRVLGVLAGALVVALTILLAPTSWALPIAMGGLIIGLWNITARPALSVAAMIVMSVGLNSSLRHTDPAHTLLEYVGLTLAAVIFGFVIGFAVVPAPRRASLPDRAADAISRTAQALISLAGSAVTEPEISIRQQRDAEAARQELAEPDDTDGDRRTDVERLSAMLKSLMAVAITVAGSPEGDRSYVDRAGRTLLGEQLTRSPPLEQEASPVERALVPTALTANELAHTLGAFERR